MAVDNQRDNRRKYPFTLASDPSFQTWWNWREWVHSSFGVSGKHMAPRSIGVACATSLPLVRGNSLFQGGTLGCDEAESSKHRRHQAGCEDTRRCLGTVQAGDEIWAIRESHFWHSAESDETHKSYLARHEVRYEELINMGANLEEMRAYILIRNSGLSPEDKKKIIIDSGGNLEYEKVTSALQLLGSKFFAEVQSGAANRTNARNKTYDVNYVDEDEPDHEEAEEPIFFSQETTEDSALEIVLAEGDPDAQVINQFEESLIDTLQSDPEIATCLNTYLEARRKISEKVKGRGFWVPKGSKGKGRGKNKGGFKQKFRKPLAQRILESTCRYCNQIGHWHAECPVRLKNANTSAPPSGNAAFAGVALASEIPPEVQSFSDDDDMPPGHATAYMTEETCYMISHRLHSPNMHINANNGDKWDNRGDYNGVSQSRCLSLPAMAEVQVVPTVSSHRQEHNEWAHPVPAQPPGQRMWPESSVRFRW